ncbi:MAG: cysteine desulfurase [[Lactobacillus] timonensis]|uniref:cysteine desulfurase family protein n=1 Tax=[Lactobacillus] timonensis TaxID=1970790 RepID=UPI000C8528E2|nr:cysteine desulfurase family protein [[Lactobacillus] timonensis]MCI1926147.1 cysteine desulfurase [[Lactobacillus] timonensis]MCI1957507.1 cysteine desulfurase [[Lactobacillus] timonensis]MCI1970583.1 cysteine desulfurase [[Lactobacillus] timonensis]MCI2006701.1 cysteine desulfurase [[Lactobacillus] timonensis]
MAEVYLDNAATTPMVQPVIDVLVDQLNHHWGNASTGYGYGRDAKRVLEDSRHVIAQSIGARDDEIVFTSGGSEGDNTAIIQVAHARAKLGKHIITTAIEHDAVLKSCQALEAEGFRVTYLPVDERGMISLTDLKEALDDQTTLVSVMMANNEVGTKMPIRQIGELLVDHQAWFHTDAVQAYGLEDIDVNRDHIDLLSTSAHKINGPKMMGFLYRREGLNFSSLIKGGEQETKRRAGTENVPAAAAFAKAVSLLTPAEKDHRGQKFLGFKHELVRQLTKHGIDFAVNGSPIDEAMPQIINLWIKGVPTQVMQNGLDLAGFAVSGGSACTAGNVEPSHVLVAMFGPVSPRITESIRVSFGVMNTIEQVDALATNIVKIVKRVKGE